MSEEKKATDVTPEGNNDSTSGESSENNYSADFVEKLKKEKENFRSVAQQKNEELETLKAEQKTRTEDALKEKEDFKKLYEMKTAELETIQGKLNESTVEKVDSNKASVLKKELVKLGLDPAYADKAAKLADLKQIKIDTETGVMYGADMVAKGLSEDWPALFGTPSETVTQNAPESPAPTGALTLKAWQELPYAEKIKRQGEIYGVKT